MIEFFVSPKDAMNRRIVLGWLTKGDFYNEVFSRSAGDRAKQE